MVMMVMMVMIYLQNSKVELLLKNANAQQSILMDANFIQTKKDKHESEN